MKLMKSAIVIAGLAACVAAQAEWTLIDDFESYAEDTYVQGGVPDLIYPAYYNGGQGVMEIYANVPGAGGDSMKAAYFHKGEVFSSQGNAWHFIPFPTPIEKGTTSTIYWRFWPGETVDNNYFFGFTPLDTHTNDAGELWGDFACVIRHTAVNPIGFSAHNGSGYSNSYIEGADPSLWDPTPGEWVECWLVIDNSWDESGATPVVTGGWHLYTKGPGDAEPVLRIWGDASNNFSQMGFRNKTASSQKYLMVAQISETANNGGENVWLIDDIWQSDGECIKVPPEACASAPTTWCGMTVVDGNVDTGDWMGWIYVADCPDGGPGWIYNYNVGEWLYIAGCPAMEGAWVYVIINCS